MALSSFQKALKVASELRNRQLEAETLREMAQVGLCVCGECVALCTLMGAQSG